MHHPIPVDPREEFQADFDRCDALMFWFNPRHCVIVWRDGPQYLRPADAAKRIRDLRPGDSVFWRGKPRTIHSVSVYA